MAGLEPATSKVFCSIVGENLVISALKKADREDAEVLRTFDVRCVRPKRAAS